MFIFTPKKGVQPFFSPKKTRETKTLSFQKPGFGGRDEQNSEKHKWKKPKQQILGGVAFGKKSPMIIVFLFLFFVFKITVVELELVMFLFSAYINLFSIYKPLHCIHFFILQSWPQRGQPPLSLRCEGNRNLSREWNWQSSSPEESGVHFFFWGFSDLTIAREGISVKERDLHDWWCFSLSTLVVGDFPWFHFFHMGSGCLKWETPETGCWNLLHEERHKFHARIELLCGFAPGETYR